MRLRLAAFLFLLLFLLLPPGFAAAQDTGLPFTVEIVERDRPDFPALHSFAWGEDGGRWLLVAGRTDGLHGFGDDPFPTAFANDRLWVVDPETGEAWSAGLDGLPDDVAESLQVTNPQWHQEDDVLYVVGGYGHSDAAGTMVTFSTLTAFDVPAVIDAIVNGGDPADHIRQTTDDRLRVTGGELFQIGGEYYLVGGQRFDGEYSGPGSEFEQEYTSEIRAFDIEDGDSGLPRVADYAVRVSDDDQLHRRDFAGAPFIDADGRAGIAVYGGVFRPDVDLPYLSPIYFVPDDPDRAYAVAEFEQQIAHYTAPTLPLYDAATGATHTTIFGGMGLYFVDDATGEVSDPDPRVPFIDDVTTVTRAADGATSETIQDFSMPTFLGTNAIFVADPDAPHVEGTEVIALGGLDGRTLVGRIYGGLEATTPNPGRFGGDGGESFPSWRLFEVYVTPRSTSAEPGAATAFEVEGPYPNPFVGSTAVAVVLDRPEAVRVEAFDALGRRVAVLFDGPLAANRRHTFELDGAGLPAGAYLVRLTGETFRATRAAVRVR